MAVELGQPGLSLVVEHDYGPDHIFDFVRLDSLVHVHSCKFLIEEHHLTYRKSSK